MIHWFFLIVSISFNMKNWMHISMVNMEWIYIVIGMLIGGVRKMQDIAILLREKKISKILYSVNRILEIASGGGNGFMHESNRIPCYVEYYLFYYNAANKVNFNQEEIAVAIESLWQLIDMVIDKNIPTPILAWRMTNIFENIKYIESLITGDFYLYGLLNYIEKNVNTIKNE